jgi:membrane-associated phospholipid phosphatase
MPQKSLQGHMQKIEETSLGVETSSQPWYYLSRRAKLLFAVYAVSLGLFVLLAWWVHINPVVPTDVWITKEFQENPAPWLHITMSIISFPGNSYLLSLLVLLTSAIFWVVSLRLEAVVIIALYGITDILNDLLKLLIARPRPTENLVEVFQEAAGMSFPSGHVMSYLAFWGLLFCFGIILFTGKPWWRILLLATSGLFVVLVGPSRIYLGDHWATDVLGAYLIESVLLGLALWFYLRLKELVHSQETFTGMDK